MSHCVEKLPHDCGTSDGLQVFEDDGRITGYCFSCDTYIPHPYGDSTPIDIKSRTKIKKSPEEVDRQLREIDAYQTTDLPDRHLTKETLNYFNIKIGLSEQDGVTPILHYYPYTRDGKRVSYKARLAPEKIMWVVGDFKDVDLFGWEQAIQTGAKRLYITEGELDAASLFQALKDKERGTKYEEYNPAVVSLTNGASGAKKNILKSLPSIRGAFKEVVFVFDSDEAGRAATEEAIQILPTAHSAIIPGKDPNDCLVNGRSKALCNAVLFNSATPKNTRLVWGQSLHEAGRTPPEHGLSWPWVGMTKLTKGMRFGETYYAGAGVKMGKSELVKTLIAHFITTHQLKVFAACPEEANKFTYQQVVGKVAGHIFHDPDRPFNYEAYDEASKVICDNLCLLDVYQHVGWDSLRADIMSAAAEECKAIFIDPITNLVNGVPAADANTVLQSIAQDLAAIAKDLNLIIFIFCHLKAPEAGPPHERGGKVLSAQFAGSRAMMRSCHAMYGLEGNKDPDLEEEERNIRRLVILEDRQFGASGGVYLYWDKNTGLFNEMRER